MGRTRAEDFFFDDGHFGRNIGKNSRLDKVSLGTMTLATQMHRRAFFLANVNIVHDAL